MYVCIKAVLVITRRIVYSLLLCICNFHNVLIPVDLCLSEHYLYRPISGIIDIYVHFSDLKSNLNPSEILKYIYVCCFHYFTNNESPFI